MKNYVLIFTCLLLYNSYSQSRDIIHFFINKKDTLIQKQLATKTNEYEGYRIIDENRLIKKYKTSFKEKPANIVLKKGEIWVSEGDDIEYDAFDEYSFSFNREDDTIVNKSYLKGQDVIYTRKEFLNKNKELNEAWTDFIFIEPIDCDNIILRKVNPLIFE